MRLQCHKTMLFSAFLLAGPRLMLSQEPPASQATNSPGSPEEAMEQSLHRIAAIYRAMAVISESDPVPVRELKRQYARLAEEQENAAAAYHARRVALIRQCAPVKLPKHVDFGK